ncbi:MAG: hypothetical protein EZS26_003251 [Candidatus Ordinivivax streblomastigis]|uniref:Uncharacterized protein n=1 Tax=Candidatus Ordinivivax streblomastigis TaxID=2540710 RepID=A0A5M8NU46_9BACT|nr:MAG: hypothetical protein EZS26_003251 [Candidatus Ordinivivax streblomastigis]
MKANKKTIYYESNPYLIKNQKLRKKYVYESYRALLKTAIFYAIKKEI